MPRPLDDILGQDHAVRVLTAPLAAGRAHHAYVFHGPVGVGKFTTALAFAQELLAPGDDAAPPENSDLHVVTKELARYAEDRATRQRKLTRIPVDVLREHLIEPAHRAAHGRHGKVFIVDEAELLGPAGQNVLLKTLEEPPRDTRIILVTSSEDRLLPTIRSRCQRVAFVPLPDDVIQQWSEEHAGEWSARLKDWLVKFAGGSLGRARLAVDYELDQWASRVLPAVNGLAQNKPDPELGAAIAGFIDGLAKAWVEAHDGASKEAANKLAAGLMGSMLATHARFKIADAAGGCDATNPEASEGVLGPWLGVIDAVGEAERLLGSNVNLSLVCDHLALSMEASLRGGGDPMTRPKAHAGVGGGT